MCPSGRSLSSGLEPTTSSLGTREEQRMAHEERPWGGTEGILAGPKKCKYRQRFVNGGSRQEKAERGGRASRSPKRAANGKKT